MPKKRLTEAFVKSAKALTTDKGKVTVTEYADETTQGLALRVTPKGVKSWTYRYRANGIQKRLSLGKVDQVPLVDARKTAKAVIGQVASGVDPVMEKKLAKLASVENLGLRTVDQVWSLYDKECEAGRHRPKGKPKRQSTLELERYYYNGTIAPTLGAFELADLQKAHIQKFISGLNKSAAQRCQSILQSLFTFAQRNEIVDHNPAQFITTTGIVSRDRVLSEHELRALWEAFTPPIAKGVSLGVAYASRLAMVTLQRRGEVAEMNLQELDLEKRIWTIPASRTKNSRTHLVPLSDLAVELIEQAIECRSHTLDFVFPSPKHIDAPINPRAITRAFGRLRPMLNLKDVRPHDLRRTGATNLTSENLGFSRFIVSQVLNHTSDTGGAAAVTSTYDRNEYLVQKRRALNAWAERLQEIVENKPAQSNVVKLHSA